MAQWEVVLILVHQYVLYHDVFVWYTWETDCWSAMCAAATKVPMMWSARYAATGVPINQGECNSAANNQGA